MFNKVKYIISLLLVVTMLVPVVQSFGQQKMTLEDCRKQAIENNKELKKANLQILEAEHLKKAAKTNRLPSFSADVNAMHLMGIDDIEVPGSFLPTADQNGNITGLSNVYMPGVSIEMGDLSLVYGGLSVAQPVYTGGKISTGNQMAEVGVHMAELAKDLKYSEIIELTDNAFWSVSMVESNIELAKKYIEMLTELEDQMSSMHDVGLKPASEKLKVGVQRNQAELQLMKAENGLKLAKMNLNQILGLELNADINIVYDTLSEIKLQDLSNGAELAEANRGELKLLDKQVQMSEFNKKMTKADYLPQIGLGIQYNGTWVEEFREDIDFNPMIAAQITIPIFNWGEGYHKQKAAKLNIQQAKLDLSNTSEKLNLEVMQTKIKLEEAYESILLAKENIKEAETSLGETKSSFDVGLNTTSELLIAQADWMNAKVQYVQAIASYKILETTWERVTGNLNADNN